MKVKEFLMKEFFMTNAYVIGESNLNLAKMCLSRIRDIAARGASSNNPENVGYALQELTQVLFERTGSQERMFEPVSAELLTGLRNLHEELALVDSLSESMAASDHGGCSIGFHPTHN
jgi:hypothetical protein